VGDLEKSLTFYTKILNMHLLRHKNYPDGKFTLTFVNYQDEADDAVIKLTHNWDTSSYNLGDGYGHIALEVEDAYKACEEIKTRGDKITRKTNPMKHGQTIITFVENPDNYKIELIQKKSRVN